MSAADRRSIRLIIALPGAEDAEAHVTCCRTHADDAPTMRLQREERQRHVALRRGLWRRAHAGPRDTSSINPADQRARRQCRPAPRCDRERPFNAATAVRVTGRESAGGAPA